MLKFFERKRETELRQWCVEQVIKSMSPGRGIGHSATMSEIKETADRLYRMVVSKK